MEVFIINAFNKERFGGNPAAVVPLQERLDDKVMQAMAAQHNLSETAFIQKQGEDYSIRWFTPTLEVDLCGHATLAAAHVLFHHLGLDKEKIVFHSKSGPLPVKREIDGKLTLDFPSLASVETTAPAQLSEGLGVRPVAVFSSRFDFLVLLSQKADIEKLSPDFSLLAKLDARGTIVTAKGDDSDFVSRCFYPQSGINEDPATGSAHAALAPFWAHRLGKTKLTALQLSSRQGWFDCEFLGERTLISGFATTYLSGEIFKT
jgi:PhzF family phenazine biosynthesis protein